MSFTFECFTLTDNDLVALICKTRRLNKFNEGTVKESHCDIVKYTCGRVGQIST